MSEIETLTFACARSTPAIFAVALNVAGAAFVGLSGVAAARVAFSASYFIWMELLARKQSA